MAPSSCNLFVLAAKYYFDLCEIYSICMANRFTPKSNSNSRQSSIHRGLHQIKKNTNVFQFLNRNARALTFIHFIPVFPERWQQELFWIHLTFVRSLINRHNLHNLFTECDIFDNKFWFLLARFES